MRYFEIEVEEGDLHGITMFWGKLFHAQLALLLTGGKIEWWHILLRPESYDDLQLQRENEFEEKLGHSHGHIYLIRVVGHPDTKAVVAVLPPYAVERILRPGEILRVGDMVRPVFRGPDLPVHSHSPGCPCGFDVSPPQQAPHSGLHVRVPRRSALERLLARRPIHRGDH